MEVETELDFYQKIVDFIVLNKPELRASHIKLKVIGEECPSTFIIMVEVRNECEDADQRVTTCGIIIYECSFHCETPKSCTHISYILTLRNKDQVVRNAGEEICYASLSSDKKFIGITIHSKENEERVYSCYIINISSITQTNEITKLHTSPSFKEICRIQFIPTPANALRSKSLLTRKSIFAKLQSTHIIFSVEKTLIKYQRVLLSTKLALVENETILSRKLYFNELKSDLDRLYILETSAVGTFNLKSFQIMWPQCEEKEMQTYEFQLLFSYQIQLSTLQIDSSPINCHVLEHSNGTICFCYELCKGPEEDIYNRYFYCLHLINASNIIECRTPEFVMNPPGKVLFTMYKSYIVIFTKYFVHMIDIYCHSKQTCSYIWPTCFEEQQFLDLACLNSLKLSKMYFLHETKCILSVKPNLHRVATMIKESNSVTQKIGALNFIVFNHFRNNHEDVSQFAVECIIYNIKNSFTMSRLMEEYITASVHRYLRVKDNEERFMRFINNTTLSVQYSSKLLASINSEDSIAEDDLIKINIKIINNNALVIFVKDNLPNPQINRFLRLSSDAHNYKVKKDSNNTQPSKIELIFENNAYSDEPNLPSYLVNLSLSNKQIQEMDALIFQKTFNNNNKVEASSMQCFVEKIRSCTIRAWKKLLFLIHKAAFDDDKKLWEDLRLLRRIEDDKINSFHTAIGAFRYVLLKEKISVPHSIDEMYLITSYNVLSNERFLIYLTYTNFFSFSSVFSEFFTEFYIKYSADSGNDLLIKIKDKLLSKMTVTIKMDLLRCLNPEDQSQVIREYWDIMNYRTNVFNERYSDIIQIISNSCDTPQNSLLQFYKQSSLQLPIGERPKL